MRKYRSYTPKKNSLLGCNVRTRPGTNRPAVYIGRHGEDDFFGELTLSSFVSEENVLKLVNWPIRSPNTLEGQI